MANALATAFGTASSSATLPVTLNALENKNNIDPRITRYGYTLETDAKNLDWLKIWLLLKNL